MRSAALLPLVRSCCLKHFRWDFGPWRWQSTCLTRWEMGTCEFPCISQGHPQWRSSKGIPTNQFWYRKSSNLPIYIYTYIKIILHRERKSRCFLWFEIFVWLQSWWLWTKPFCNIENGPPFLQGSNPWNRTSWESKGITGLLTTIVPLDSRDSSWISSKNLRIQATDDVFRVEVFDVQGNLVDAATAITAPELLSPSRWPVTRTS